ncbi:TetR/AcrR family transcriptional regulator [Peribacillus sp. NPDC096379]|uniref:TetR/AcrR family transcriptional regulator n=1 Tax=Peribacillus sp. NPDC096379 TaxID=3364393 RepID=UPI0037FB779D
MKKEKKEDIRAQITRKLLNEALFDLMKKHDFNRITVKQLCDVSNVHRTTFYAHFEDKYALLSYAIKQIGKDVEEQLNFKEVHMCLFEVADKNKDLFAQLFLEERDSLRSILRMEMYAAIIDRFEKAGKEIQIEQEIMIEALIGSILGVLNWWITNNRPIPIEEIYEKVQTLGNLDYYLKSHGMLLK